ncbi:MAG TPA: protein kinase [Trichormus sp.]
MEQSKVPDNAPGTTSGVSAAADPWIGRLIAKRFRVEGTIGAGGMSTVYKALDLSLGREVAIKVLIPKLNASQSNLLRFQKEAKALSSLNHDNIVRVWEYGIIEDTVQFMVMEYLSGSPLSDELQKEGTLSIERTVSIVNQICNALSHAHTHNIVHRDLKPSNVVLESSQGIKDHVKIIDFGIAKLISDTGIQNLTSTGEIFGSPYYMSPEQCGGLHVDKRSDIYSLGCIMYECLAGTPPFIGDTPLSTLMKHQQDKPLSLKEATLGKSFPPVLEQIVSRMLQKRPADRYQLAEEVQLDLDRLKNVDWSNQESTSDLALAYHPSQFSTLLPLQVVKTAMPVAEEKSGTVLHRQFLIGGTLVALVMIGLVIFVLINTVNRKEEQLSQEQAERITQKNKQPGLGLLTDVKDTVSQMIDNNTLGIAIVDSGPYSIDCTAKVVNNPADWAKLTNKKDLQNVNLTQTDVTDAQVASLAKFPLRYLDLSTCKNVSAQGLKAIENMPTLQVFDFGHGSPDPACCFVHFNPNLVDLRLNSDSVYDEGVKYLLRLKRLRRLDLRNNYLTDKSLKTLRQFKNLDSLDLRGNSALTWSALGELSHAMPNCVIYVNTNLDDRSPDRQGSPNAFFRQRGPEDSATQSSKQQTDTGAKQPGSDKQQDNLPSF